MILRSAPSSGGNNPSAALYKISIKPFVVSLSNHIHTKYFDEDDILVIRLSDKPIVREVSQNWNTYISYAEDSSAVEVLLEVRDYVAYPPEVQHTRAACIPCRVGNFAH